MPPVPTRVEILDPDLLEKVVSLCLRRGLVYRSASIYGGFRSTYDYGPIGVQLLRNVKDAWWREMTQLRPDVVGLDASILSPPAVWEASGHLANFSDPLVDCRDCKERFRLDKLEDLNRCPNCDAVDSFTEPKPFNLMFKTHAGPVEGAGHDAYLRPETAQGMFINFMNVLNTMPGIKPPFGIAQTGKSFRNEITPQNFVFRTREFEQMELEFFVPPSEAQHWYEYWCDERPTWYMKLGIPASKLRLRAHTAEELSHYSSGTSDVEFAFPWGFDELEGIANRGDFDLTQHARHSGQRLDYFDPRTGERYVPHVIEPAAGATRAMMAFTMAAYREEALANGESRTVLGLHPSLAPYKVAVLPLQRKPDLVEPARTLARRLRELCPCACDETASIGKRYRRQDEIGTPFCITVDRETLDDGTVTVRDRDEMTQFRIAADELPGKIRSLLDAKGEAISARAVAS
jgi:glycyl-tRNA synthetase